MWRIFAILIVVLLTVQAFGIHNNLKVEVAFKELDFEFPSSAAEIHAVQQGYFVRGNAVPIDVAVHYKGRGHKRTFVSIPRFTTGIPVTFGTIHKANDGINKIRGYPNYSWHSSHGADCDDITSVFRVAIDECNRLWILDTGRVGNQTYCPPQLLVFDLITDQLLRRYRFPTSVYKPGISLLITLIVDVRDPYCLDTMVYIADALGYGIVMYDAYSNTSWRAENKLLLPNLQYQTVTIAGQSFDLMDGVFGLSVSPIHYRYSRRYLYFHAFASYQENVVPLKVLDNRQLWNKNIGAASNSFRVIGNRGTQTAAEAMDSRGNLYFGLMTPIAIGVWNIRTFYNRANINILAHDRNTLQFASGVKIVRNTRNEEELWILTCRFQRIATNTKNSSEINFRILSMNLGGL